MFALWIVCSSLPNTYNFSFFFTFLNCLKNQRCIMAWVFKIHLAVTVCVFCEICHNLEFSLLHTVLFYPIYLKSQIFWNKSWKFQVGYSWRTGFLKSICIWLIKFTTILDFCFFAMFQCTLIKAHCHILLKIKPK